VSETPGGRTQAEWISFAVALAVLTAVVALLIYTWVNTSDLPPHMKVLRSGTIREAEGEYYVPFTVENRGGRTAQAVRIVAEWQEPGAPLRTAEQEIDFLAPGEQEQGTFVFPRDPRRSRLVLRVSGFRNP
jgi:uncharacterized protein (TIGR02588 family)